MTEHCVLVLAHANPATFTRLVTALAPQFHVLAHVDARADQSLFAADAPAARFLDDRYAIGWGSYAMVQATLDLLLLGLRTTPAQTFTLVSGDTYLIRSPDFLRAALDPLRDRMSLTVVEESSKTYRRIREVYLPDTRIGTLRPGVDSNERHLDAALLAQIGDAAAAATNRPGFIRDYVYAKGAQWWSLTRDTAERVRDVVEADPRFREAFRFSAIPDESFFQTAVLKAGIDPKQLQYGLVFTHWQGGPSPRTFVDAADFDLLTQTQRPFARKFTDASAALIERVERELWFQGAAA